MSGWGRKKAVKKVPGGTVRATPGKKNDAQVPLGGKEDSIGEETSSIPERESEKSSAWEATYCSAGELQRKLSLRRKDMSIQEKDAAGESASGRRCRTKGKSSGVSRGKKKTVHRLNALTAASEKKGEGRSPERVGGDILRSRDWYLSTTTNVLSTEENHPRTPRPTRNPERKKGGIRALRRGGGRGG